MAIEDENILGTGSLANFGSEEIPSYYDTAIFVALEFHGRGIGRQIMHAVEAKAKELGGDKLIIRSAVNAKEFYEKLGYCYQDTSPGKTKKATSFW